MYKYILGGCVGRGISSCTSFSTSYPIFARENAGIYHCVYIYIYIYAYNFSSVRTPPRCLLLVSLFLSFSFLSYFFPLLFFLFLFFFFACLFSLSRFTSALVIVYMYVCIYVYIYSESFRSILEEKARKSKVTSASDISPSQRPPLRRRVKKKNIYTPRHHYICIKIQQSYIAN